MGCSPAKSPAQAPATKKASTKPAASVAKENAKPASAKKPATPAQSLALKPEFKSVTPTEAVKQILQKAGKPMATDDVIGSLYQSVKGADLSTARKSVALILGRGTHQGIYEKVGENPSRYQLKA